MTERSQEIIQTLKAYGEGFGLSLRGEWVVIVGPGSNYSERPTNFARADLESAISAGLLQKSRLTTSFDLDIWVAKQ